MVGTPSWMGQSNFSELKEEKARPAASNCGHSLILHPVCVPVASVHPTEIDRAIRDFGKAEKLFSFSESRHSQIE